MQLIHTHRPATAPIAVAIVLLSACAATPPSDTYRQDTFRDGQVVLDCTDIICAARWRSNADELRSLYAAGAWESLAALVSNTQYGSDLAYFYLGRAAEELHHYGAAHGYFGRAMAAPVRCDAGLFRACDAIDPPEAARMHRERIAGLLSGPPMDTVAAQRRLAALGLYTAGIDGIAGPRTRAALRRFQELRGVTVSGELDAMTSVVLAGVVPDADLQPAPQESVAVVPQNTPRADAAPAPATPTAAVQQPAQASIDVAPVAEPVRDAATQRRSRVTMEVELLSDADPFADVVTVVTQGTWVDIIHRGNEWSKISHEDKTGFVYTDFLQ